MTGRVTASPDGGDHDHDSPDGGNSSHDSNAPMRVDKAHTKKNNTPTCVDKEPANKKTQQTKNNSQDGGDNDHNINNNNDHNTPVYVDKAPANKTKHTSKGKKGDAPMSVEAAQRNNDNHPAPLSKDATYKDTTDPTSFSNAINDTMSSTTTITTNVPTPISTVETRGGAAGDTHPVSPTAGPKEWVAPDQGTLQLLDIMSCSINLKALDSVIHSPPPLSRLELEGASRTHGGIFRGCALGTQPNLADMDSTSDTKIPYPSKIHL